jgi:hypothetical protein
VTGEVSRGRIVPADRSGVRKFLARFAGLELEVALEATTGWRFVVDASREDAEASASRFTRWSRAAAASELSDPVRWSGSSPASFDLDRPPRRSLFAGGTVRRSRPRQDADGPRQLNDLLEPGAAYPTIPHTPSPGWATPAERFQVARVRATSGIGRVVFFW